MCVCRPNPTDEPGPAHPGGNPTSAKVVTALAVTFVCLVALGALFVYVDARVCARVVQTHSTIAHMTHRGRSCVTFGVVVCTDITLDGNGKPQRRWRGMVHSPMTWATLTFDALRRCVFDIRFSWSIVLPAAAANQCK